MRNAFYLFDDAKDRFRARQVMETAEGVRAVPDNLVTIASATSPDSAMKSRIDNAIAAAECLVVLIGEHTDADPQVIYAVGRAVHEFRTPVIGVRIDKLADDDGAQGLPGDDPFSRSGLSARALLQIDTYDPPFTTSVFARSHIRYSLRDWMESAIRESMRRNEARGRRMRPSATCA